LHQSIKRDAATSPVHAGEDQAMHPPSHARAISHGRMLMLESIEVPQGFNSDRAEVQI
jgi:hypothetical protein